MNGLKLARCSVESWSKGEANARLAWQISKGSVNLSGVYSHNKLFDTFYLAGAQDLPELEEDVYVESATAMTLFEAYEDYLPDGWPDFIEDFCE